jgi:hypothetical protein
LPTLPVGRGDVIGREVRTQGIETSPVKAGCRALDGAAAAHAAIDRLTRLPDDRPVSADT